MYTFDLDDIKNSILSAKNLSYKLQVDILQ